MRRIILLFLLVLVSALGFAQTVLKPLDKVRVTCEEEATLSRDYGITPDGLLLMSFIGAVKVAGLTEQQAAKRISDELIRQRILRTATVTLKIVSTTQAPVKISGAVKNFGEIPWKEVLKLADIVKIVQPTQQADLSNIQISGRDGRTVIADYQGFLDGKNTTGNPMIRSGDTIVFLVKSASEMVYVLGAVKQPGGIPIKPRMTLADAIEAAGGLLPEADTTKVQAERRSAPNSTLNLATAADREVQPGDRYVIGFIPRTQSVTVVGAVADPGPVTLTAGMTLSQAIKKAGGIAKGAKPGDVRIERKQGQKSQTIKVSYAKMVDGKVPDPVLQAGDRIDVTQPRRSSLDRTLTTIGGILFFFLLGG